MYKVTNFIRNRWWLVSILITVLGIVLFVLIVKTGIYIAKIVEPPPPQKCWFCFDFRGLDYVPYEFVVIIAVLMTISAVFSKNKKIFASFLTGIFSSILFLFALGSAVTSHPVPTIATIVGGFLLGALISFFTLKK